MAKTKIRPTFRPIVSILGGGSAVKFIEDPWFEYSDYVISLIGGVADNGGHTGMLREALKMLEMKFPNSFRQLSGAIGDASKRMINHIRVSDEEKEIFGFRFPQGDYALSEHRPITDFVAAGVILKNGLLSEGILWAQRRLSDYVGTVIPVTDSVVELGIGFEDGSYKVGERNIDEMQRGDSPIKFIKYEPKTPVLLPAAAKALVNSDLIISAPATVHGSTKPPYEVPGFAEAIKEAQNRGAIFVLIVNAVNHPETEDWPASKHCSIPSEYGIKPNIIFINRLTHRIPDSYLKDEGALPVKVDLKKCEKLGDQVIYKPLTKLVKEYYGLEFENGVLVHKSVRDVVRHNGVIIAEDLMEIIQSKKEALLERSRFTDETFPQR